MPVQASFATQAPYVPRERVPRHDVDAVAALLGLSPVTVRRRVREGRWPHVRLGGAIRFRDVDVEVILAEARVSAR